MGYYIRILGIENPDIHIDQLINGLAKDELKAQFSLLENETADNWTVIDIANANGDDLMQIERNPVIEGELGMGELDEFREEIKDYKPSSAVKWLDNYFNKVKVIYAFQLLDAVFDDNNFPIVDSIRQTIWAETGGILQSDNEGFSNEKGHYILWQFSDNVKGEWRMAVKNIFGQWTNFTMDLGDQEQRKEFWEGKVPKGAIKI